MSLLSDCSMDSITVSLIDEDLVRYGAESAAITRGHSWGYIPAGMLALIIRKAVFSSDPLPEIIQYSLDVTRKVFHDNGYWEGFESLIYKSIECAANGDGDEVNIHKLGEGWVGHEALAIAVYCALRYPHDFSNAITAAVNHNGDSDSTGYQFAGLLSALLQVWTALKIMAGEAGTDRYDPGDQH